jgi:hypothetical protein
LQIREHRAKNGRTEEKAPHDFSYDPRHSQAGEDVAAHMSGGQQQRQRENEAG